MNVISEKKRVEERGIKDVGFQGSGIKSVSTNVFTITIGMYSNDALGVGSDLSWDFLQLFFYKVCGCLVSSFIHFFNVQFIFFFAEKAKHKKVIN